MRKIIILFILFVASYSSSFNHSLFNKNNYFKSGILNNKVNHIYRLEIYKDNMPLYIQNEEFLAGNIYYLYFDGDKVLKRINNMIMQDNQHKEADIAVLCEKNGTIKIVVPSSGGMIVLLPGESIPIPVFKLGLTNLNNIVYNFLYLRSF